LRAREIPWPRGRAGQRDVTSQRRLGQDRNRDLGAGPLGVRTWQDRHSHFAGDQSLDPLALVGLELDLGLEAGMARRERQELAQPCSLAVADEMLAGKLGHA
jgi:hypothetical protein